MNPHKEKVTEGAWSMKRVSSWEGVSAGSGQARFQEAAGGLRESKPEPLLRFSAEVVIGRLLRQVLSYRR